MGTPHEVVPYRCSPFRGLVTFLENATDTHADAHPFVEPMVIMTILLLNACIGVWQVLLACCGVLPHYRPCVLPVCMAVSLCLSLPLSLSMPVCVCVCV